MRTKRVISKHDRMVIATVVSVVVLIALTFTYLIYEFDKVTAEQTTQHITSHHTTLSLKLIEWEQQIPILTMILFFIVNISGALYVTYITSRLSFYPIVTKYPIVLFCVVSIAICSSEPYKLLSAATLLISLLTFGNILSVNEERASGYTQSLGENAATTSSSSRIFSAVFYMGLLVLIHPSAIILWLTVPMLIFFYNRPLQEFLILVIAFILPTALEGYFMWIMGHSVSAIADYYSGLLVRDGSFFLSPSLLWGAISARYLLYIDMLLVTFISTWGAIRLGSVSLSARTLQRYGAMISTWVLMMLMIFLSSYSTASWAMIVVPTAIIMTMAFITMRRWVSIIMIGLVVGLSIAVVFAN